MCWGARPGATDLLRSSPENFRLAENSPENSVGTTSCQVANCDHQAGLIIPRQSLGRAPGRTRLLSPAEGKAAFAYSYARTSTSGGVQLTVPYGDRGTLGYTASHVPVLVTCGNTVTHTVTQCRLCYLLRHILPYLVVRQGRHYLFSPVNLAGSTPPLPRLPWIRKTEVNMGRRKGSMMAHEGLVRV